MFTSADTLEINLRTSPNTRSRMATLPDTTPGHVHKGLQSLLQRTTILRDSQVPSVLHSTSPPARPPTSLRVQSGESPWPHPPHPPLLPNSQHLPQIPQPVSQPSLTPCYPAANHWIPAITHRSLLNHTNSVPSQISHAIVQGLTSYVWSPIPSPQPTRSNLEPLFSVLVSSGPPCLYVCLCLDLQFDSIDQHFCFYANATPFSLL